MARWLWRKRLRLTGYGLNCCESPVNLHNQQMLFSEHQFWERVVTDENDENDDKASRTTTMATTTTTNSASTTTTITATDAADDAVPCVLPVLALNEVYIGETLSSRYLHCGSSSSVVVVVVVIVVVVA